MSVDASAIHASPVELASAFVADLNTCSSSSSIKTEGSPASACNSTNHSYLVCRGEDALQTLRDRLMAST